MAGEIEHVDPVDKAFRWVWEHSPKRNVKASKGHKGDAHTNFRRACREHGLDVCIGAFRNYLGVVATGQLPKDSERFWKKEYEKYIEIEDGPVVSKRDRRAEVLGDLADWANRRDAELEGRPE